MLSIVCLVLCGSSNHLVVFWGVSKLSFPPKSHPPNTQVEGALPGIEDGVEATPTPLEGKEASAEQSMEDPEAKA